VKLTKRQRTDSEVMDALVRFLSSRRDEMNLLASTASDDIRRTCAAARALEVRVIEMELDRLKRAALAERGDGAEVGR